MFRVNYPRLKSYARKFVDESTAEDLVQDIFLNFWNKKRDNKIDNPESYLFISTRNACYNHLKKLMIERTVFELKSHNDKSEHLYTMDYLQEEEIKSLKERLSDEVNKKIDHLPPRCREVFKLSRNGGLKNREIAKKIGISEKVVEKHITRAFRILRNHFKVN